MEMKRQCMQNWKRPDQRHADETVAVACNSNNITQKPQKKQPLSLCCLSPYLIFFMSLSLLVFVWRRRRKKMPYHNIICGSWINGVSFFRQLMGGKQKEIREHNSFWLLYPLLISDIPVLYPPTLSFSSLLIWAFCMSLCCCFPNLIHGHTLHRNPTSFFPFFFPTSSQKP